MTLLFGDMDPEAVFTFRMDNDANDMLCFLTEQMSAKHGLKLFGTAREDTIIKELEQLVYRKVMEGLKANDLTTAQKKAALHYLMFLKQKLCDWIKGRRCADGWKYPLL